MKRLIDWVKRHFKKKQIKVEAIETPDGFNLQYPTFEEFEEAVRKGKPFKLD